ncbi:hypothetical protein HOJ44_07905, partial [Candidatus Bathyarchaeota archaeon]|nr:hypothetical protein [Candidatus Bathyarchaeota archaeon]
MTDHKFIESIKAKNDTDSRKRVYRVPTAEIDFGNYTPVKWGVEYIQLADEADEL